MNKEFLNYIKRLKNLADIGLLYAKDGYDTERYEELKDISRKMLHLLTDTPLSILNDFYARERDYPTPKVDVRAFVMNDNKEILLVKEKADGRWSLPGGWADIGLSASEVAVKEVKEEAGLDIEVTRLLAVYDKKCHPHPPEKWYVYKIIFLCKILINNTIENDAILRGMFQKGHDVLDVAFFSVKKLPPLSENRILASQIQTLFDHIEKGNTDTLFD
jgi:ADP-ribose pyrophosphatase YjhB (NUDIX family)